MVLLGDILFGVYLIFYLEKIGVLKAGVTRLEQFSMG
jgi:hypothetical protein